MTGYEHSADVIVVGGGPAGSTAAAVLRERGRSVVLLEKDVHPRFHIGESLLPYNLPLFDRLGVRDRVAGIGVVKPGVDFTLPESNDYVRYAFAEAFDPTPESAFQVRRSEFDHILLRNAADKGVEVHEGVRIADVELADEAGVVVRTAGNGGGREWRGRFLIDASGRDTLLGRKLEMKRPHPDHRSAAIYAHLENAPKRPGAAGGDISIYWFDKGWIWMIPLRDGVTSVGVVAHPAFFERPSGELRDTFWAGVRRSPPAARRLVQARMITEPTATGNYSYMCRAMTGPNFTLVGDAFAFVDPVFSSGVYLAMTGAESAAEAVDVWLTSKARGKRLLKRHETRIRRGIENFSWFIRRFNEPTMKSFFMAPRDLLGIRSAILSRLAGDVYGNRQVDARIALFKLVYAAIDRFGTVRPTASADARAADLKSDAPPG